MAKRDDSKIRLIAVYRMIENGEKLTSTQIINRLKSQFDIEVDRRTIYSDLMAINRFIPFQANRGCKGGAQKYDVLGGCLNDGT
jgi:predicted DNA-binding transcriptional regulator YafY